jgi:nicotinamidase-related amidase
LKLERDRTALVLVDVQEAFRPVVTDFDRVARNAGVLVQGANVLDVPVLVTEQYPKGLGPTVPEVADHLAGVTPVAKVRFSAAESDEFAERLRETGRDQILLCGIESHICVNQTADDLLIQGHAVHVAEDAVASRTEENRRLGLHKMEREGAVLTSVETALFELLREAGTPEFKEVQRLVK